MQPVDLHYFLPTSFLFLSFFVPVQCLTSYVRVIALSVIEILRMQANRTSSSLSSLLLRLFDLFIVREIYSNLTLMFCIHNSTCRGQHAVSTSP